MEWRKIKVTPNSKSGKIYDSVCGYDILGLPIYSTELYASAYKKSDVLCFFHDRQKEAVLSGLCTAEEFEKNNADFLDAVNKIQNWPIESCSYLENMFIPVSDVQVKYERIKLFLDNGLFPHLDLEIQVLVWEFVDTSIRSKLLGQLTKEQQKDLCAAIITQKQ